MPSIHKADAEAWIKGAERPEIPPGEAATSLAAIAQAHATLALVEATERLADAQKKATDVATDVARRVSGYLS